MIEVMEMKDQKELIKFYEDRLEKVKQMHTGWKGEEYVEFAEEQLRKVKNGENLWAEQVPTDSDS